MMNLIQLWQNIKLKTRMTYREIVKKQDICDHRREFIKKAMDYVDKKFDPFFYDEIIYIHKELLKVDYYQSVN